MVKQLKNENWIKDNLYIDDVLEHYSEEESLRYWGAYQAWQKYEKQGIDAWDYCRVIRVCGMCYVAGYFNLTESLEQSLPIARHLQEEFDSWESLAYDYAYGYQFWAKAESERTIGGIYENLTAMLLVEQGMKEGPFALDFHTKLEKTW